MTHREATQKARWMDCRVCGTTPCEPCHWPTHRGMGGAKAGWDEHEWVPLCRTHHDMLDGRNGSSPYACWMREVVVQTLKDRVGLP